MIFRLKAEATESRSEARGFHLQVEETAGGTIMKADAQTSHTGYWSGR